jgi:hypothetical protein
MSYHLRAAIFNYVLWLRTPDRIENIIRASIQELPIAIPNSYVPLKRAHLFESLHIGARGLASILPITRKRR